MPAFLRGLVVVCDFREDHLCNALALHHVTEVRRLRFLSRDLWGFHIPLTLKENFDLPNLSQGHTQHNILSIFYTAPQRIFPPHVANHAHQPSFADPIKNIGPLELCCTMLYNISPILVCNSVTALLGGGGVGGSMCKPVGGGIIVWSWNHSFCFRASVLNLKPLPYQMALINHSWMYSPCDAKKKKKRKKREGGGKKKEITGADAQEYYKTDRRAGHPRAIHQFTQVSIYRWVFEHFSACSMSCDRLIGSQSMKINRRVVPLCEYHSDLKRRQIGGC